MPHPVGFEALKGIGTDPYAWWCGRGSCEASPYPAYPPFQTIFRKILDNFQDSPYSSLLLS